MRVKLAQKPLGLRLYPLSPGPSVSYALVEMAVLSFGLFEEQDLILGNVYFSFAFWYGKRLGMF